MLYNNVLYHFNLNGCISIKYLVSCVLCHNFEQDSEKKLLEISVEVAASRTLCPLCLPHVGYKMLMSFGRTEMTLTAACMRMLNIEQ